MGIGVDLKTVPSAQIVFGCLAFAPGVAQNIG